MKSETRDGRYSRDGRTGIVVVVAYLAVASSALLGGCGLRKDLLIGPEPGPGSSGSGGIFGSGTGGGWDGGNGTGGGPAAPPRWTPIVPAGATPLVGDVPLTGVWYGAVDLTAPGFYGPPVDELTVAIDGSGMRSLAFQRFIREVAIPTPGTVSPLGQAARPATFDADSVSATGFAIKYHGRGLQGTGGDGGLGSDGSGGATGTVESLSGTLDDTGRLTVSYAFDSTEPGGPTHAVASGLLNRQDAPQVPFADLHGRWYGVVNLAPGPGFAGGPLDQLTITFDDAHELHFIGFQDFSSLPLEFGTSSAQFPLTGSRSVMAPDSLYSYDATVQSSLYAATTVSLRLRVQNHDSSTPTTDYVVSLDGTLTSAGLSVTYGLKGTMYEAPIDAHASGLLLP